LPDSRQIVTDCVESTDFVAPDGRRVRKVRFQNGTVCYYCDVPSELRSVILASLDVLEGDVFYHDHPNGEQTCLLSLGRRGLRRVRHSVPEGFELWRFEFEYVEVLLVAPNGLGGSVLEADVRFVSGSESDGADVGMYYGKAEHRSNEVAWDSDLRRVQRSRKLHADAKARSEERRKERSSS
jgi:hypothetical protein